MTLAVFVKFPPAREGYDTADGVDGDPACCCSSARQVRGHGKQTAWKDAAESRVRDQGRASGRRRRWET